MIGTVHLPIHRVDRSWLRGESKYKELVTASDSTVRKIENTYESVGIGSQSAPAVEIRKLPLEQDVTAYFVAAYHERRGWVRGTRKVVSYESENSSDSVATKEIHDYLTSADVTDTTNGSIGLLRAKTVQSDGESRTVRYRYAHEEHPSMSAGGTHQLAQKYRETAYVDDDGDQEIDDSETVLRRT